MASRQLRTPGTGAPAGLSPTSIVACALGALLCLAVVVIHVIDQHGFPGGKDPRYLQYGYWILEVAGIVAAVLLLRRQARSGWLLAIGVALGPIVFFTLTRTTGLPDATDDKGNWGEPLGIISLVVEGLLLILSVAMFLRASPEAARPGPRATV